MKTTLSAMLSLALASTVLGADKVELDQRIRTLTGKFDAMQHSDKRVPADVLQRAQGIVLLDTIKGGIGVGYAGGSGVALARDPMTHQWGPAAFVSFNQGSFGLLFGGESKFAVVLFMDPAAVHHLTESKYEFGGEIRGTAGDDSAGAVANFKSQGPILVYDDRKGLYGGAELKGGAMSPNDKANRAYYDQYLTTEDILFDKKVAPTEASKQLASTIAQHSNVNVPEKQP